MVKHTHMLVEVRNSSSSIHTHTTRLEEDETEPVSHDQTPLYVKY